jgi:hypothetical protein
VIQTPGASWKKPGNVEDPPSRTYARHGPSSTAGYAVRSHGEQKNSKPTNPLQLCAGCALFLITATFVHLMVAESCAAMLLQYSTGKVYMWAWNGMSRISDRQRPREEGPIDGKDGGTFLGSAQATDSHNGSSETVCLESAETEGARGSMPGPKFKCFKCFKGLIQPLVNGHPKDPVRATTL